MECKMVGHLFNEVFVDLFKNNAIMLKMRDVR